MRVVSGLLLAASVLLAQSKVPNLETKGGEFVLNVQSGKVRTDLVHKSRRF